MADYRKWIRVEIRSALWRNVQPQSRKSPPAVGAGGVRIEIIAQVDTPAISANAQTVC